MIPLDLDSDKDIHFLCIQQFWILLDKRSQSQIIQILLLGRQGLVAAVPTSCSGDIGPEGELVVAVVLSFFFLLLHRWWHGAARPFWNGSLDSLPLCVDDAYSYFIFVISCSKIEMRMSWPVGRKFRFNYWDCQALLGCAGECCSYMGCVDGFGFRRSGIGLN